MFYFLNIGNRILLYSVYIMYESSCSIYISTFCLFFCSSLWAFYSSLMYNFCHESYLRLFLNDISEYYNLWWLETSFHGSGHRSRFLLAPPSARALRFVRILASWIVSAHLPTTKNKEYKLGSRFGVEFHCVQSDLKPIVCIWYNWISISTYTYIFFFLVKKEISLIITSSVFVFIFILFIYFYFFLPNQTKFRDVRGLGGAGLLKRFSKWFHIALSGWNHISDIV